MDPALLESYLDQLVSEGYPPGDMLAVLSQLQTRLPPQALHDRNMVLSICRDFTSAFGQASKQRTREQLMKDFSAMERELAKGRKTKSQAQVSVSGGGSKPQDSNDPTSLQRIEHLKPMRISQLAIDTTRRGYQLPLRCMREPVRTPNLCYLFEDDFGDAVIVGIYDSEEAQSRISAAVSIGTCVTIIEPYYKIGMNGKAFLRVDKAQEILVGYPTCGIAESKTMQDWKALGNSYSAEDVPTALECYSKGLSLVPETQGFLLSNRAQVNLELQQFELAFADAYCGLRLLPKLTPKLWVRAATALRSMGMLEAALDILQEGVKVFPREAIVTGLHQEVSQEFNGKSGGRSSWLSRFATPPAQTCKQDPESTLTANGAKQKGNAAYGEKDLTAALEYYSEGLRVLVPNGSSLLASNLSAMYLSLPQADAKSAAEWAFCAAILDPTFAKAQQRYLTAVEMLTSKESEVDANATTNDDEPQNVEERLRSAKPPMMSTENLAMMRMMGQLTGLSDTAYRKDVPPIHEKYLARKGCPINMSTAAVTDSLQHAYENAVSINMHRAKLEAPGPIEPHSMDVLKRWGNPNQLEKMSNSRFGLVSRNIDSVGETRYDLRVLNGFVNHPADRLIVPITSGNESEGGTRKRPWVHLAIGFSDLHALIVANSVATPGPKHFVGWDASPYAVARSEVLVAMLKDPTVPIDCVIQCWFSLSWTAATADHFRRCAALAAQGTASKDVNQYLRLWSKPETHVPLHGARRSWQESHDSPVSTLNLSNNNVLYDVLEYNFLGDVSSEDVFEPKTGNLTWFAIPDGLGRMALAQTILNTLRLDEFVAAHKASTQGGKPCNFIRVIARQKKAQLESLRADLVSGKLSVTFDICMISADCAVDRMLWLGRRKLGEPKVVSWSNCIDYLPTTVLHKIAKTLGSNATHIGYSMNWTGDVNGANIMDYQQQAERTRLMDQADAFVANDFRLNDAADMFRIPTIANVLSYGCASVMKSRREAWTNIVFGPAVAEEFGLVLCGVHDAPYYPLARINFTPYFQWRYQSQEAEEPDAREQQKR